ncbi:MAG: TfoX/Sxy family protein [Huintestinicola sp.]|uniref:TfoX/Sxy family protein n=1 Tax=Huintestinicola sp. TaxID=2981661 RepID=UPI003F0B939C
MGTSKSYLEYILDSLSGLEDITHKSMMGEYIVYYRGKIAAYICDDRLLVKPVNAAKKHLPNAPMEPPYEGAKPMLLVEDTDNRELLMRLFTEMYDELPEPKPKKPKKK